MISGSIPLLLVPLHWHPYARISEQLFATESLLRKSEGKYRSILDKMNEAYLEVDPFGRLTFFNDSLCRISCHSRAELEQHSIGEFTSRRSLRQLAARARRVMKTGAVGSIFDFPITAKGGARRYLDVSFSRLQDEKNRWIGSHAVQSGEPAFDARPAGPRDPRGRPAFFRGRLTLPRTFLAIGLVVLRRRAG